MIELPRAALRAHVIAETAEFFSFGTNDLTQTTFGISRDDAAAFLETYRQKGIIEQDPFVSLDIDGVGELVRMAAEKGRATRPDIKLGICGEHGGDPASIRFCEEVGLDYVSCSPFRVPIARLAAAQAAVKKGARQPSGRGVDGPLRPRHGVDLHLVGIEGAVVLDQRHLVIGLLIGPHDVGLTFARRAGAPVAGVALVGAVGRGVGTLQKLEIDVLEGDVEDRRIVVLAQHHRPVGRGDDGVAVADRDDAGKRLDGDAGGRDCAGIRAPGLLQCSWPRS